jgi:hypothetical protein
MKARHVIELVLALAIFGLSAASSSAATSMTASADPVAAGTASKPQPLDLHLAVDLNSDASGLPTGVAKGIAFALPAEFIDTTGAFGTCPRETVKAEGPDECPRGSVLGSARLAGTPTVLPTTHASTDRGVLVRVGERKIVFWWHLSNPVVLQGIFDGTISTTNAPFGPLVSVDLTPLADGSGSGGLQLRTNRLELNLLRATASTEPKRTTRKPSCRQRARRIKNARRRRAAIRRCRRHKSAHRHKRARGSAQASQSGQSIAPFSSVGCSSGEWPFEARISYDNNTSESVGTKIACQAEQAPPGNPAVPPACIPGVLPCPSPARLDPRRPLVGR